MILFNSYIKKITTVIILGMIPLFFLFFSADILAYLPYKTAFSIGLPEDAELGSIIAVDEEAGEYKLSTVPYEPTILGVVVDTADIIIEREGDEGDDNGLVMEEGEAAILINGAGGSIRQGDAITSSTTPGVGMKGIDAGIVVAIALEDFQAESPDDVQLIHARISVGYAAGRPGVINSMSRAYRELVRQGPAQLSGTSSTFRFILAGSVVILAFIGGFFLFGRIALRGVEALGRNPLAKKTILSGIILNSLLTILLVVFAIFLAYVIISA